METIANKKPKIRFAKNYIVEENVDAVQWPRQCAACGGAVEVQDTIHLKETFKGFGEIRVDVPGVPYCQSCFPKIRTGKRVNQIVYMLALVIGIPLGLLLIGMAMANRNTNVVFCGFTLLLGIAIGYGLAWLLVKLPARIFLRGKMVEPVDAWLINEKKSDGMDGISVVVAIPNKDFASKFAILNGAVV